MHDLTAFFAVILPRGWFLSKKDEFSSLQDLYDALRPGAGTPVQTGTPWYAAHFVAVGEHHATDYFTAWINSTKLKVHVWRGDTRVASAMIAEAVQHFGLNDFTIELSKLVWAIVVGGGFHEAAFGIMPVDAHDFIVNYKEDA